MIDLTDFELSLSDSSLEWTFDDEINLVWTDPPFGTGKIQSGRRSEYQDRKRDDAGLEVERAINRIILHMASDGVICVCADYRIIHDVVWRLTRTIAQPLFHQGDVIWTFGLGRPRTIWWPVRHNTIATFTMERDLPGFNKEAVPREARKAPKPGYPDDKPAGSVWDYTMSNTDPERVSYPNQKPLAIVEPFILAHTQPGDVVADPFMGSGTTGIAALRNERKFLGQDTNPDALSVFRERICTSVTSPA